MTCGRPMYFNIFLWSSKATLQSAHAIKWQIRICAPDLLRTSRRVSHRFSLFVLHPNAIVYSNDNEVVEPSRVKNTPKNEPNQFKQRRTVA